MSGTSTVAVLGAGALGAAIASRLAGTGHHVQLWNRTHDRASAVAAKTSGIVAVEKAGDAVQGASVIFTVLRDGEAVAEVMGTAIAAVGDGAVWVQVSTVGPLQAGALRDMAQEHHVAFLDAPVSGSTGPAESGTLIWLVAGTQEALDRARAVLEHLGSAVKHLGTDVEGSAAKVAVNAWMTAATVAMSDVLALCDALGLEHSVLVEAVEGGPLAMPYALQKAKAMDERSYSAGFSIQLALKDLQLAASALPPGPLLGVVQERLEQAIDAGYGDDDLAAVDYDRRESRRRI